MQWRLQQQVVQRCLLLANGVAESVFLGRVERNLHLLVGQAQLLACVASSTLASTTSPRASPSRADTDEEQRMQRRAAALESGRIRVRMLTVPSHAPTATTMVLPSFLKTLTAELPPLHRLLTRTGWTPCPAWAAPRRQTEPSAEEDATRSLPGRAASACTCLPWLPSASAAVAPRAARSSAFVARPSRGAVGAHSLVERG